MGYNFRFCALPFSVLWGTTLCKSLLGAAEIRDEFSYSNIPLLEYKGEVRLVPTAAAPPYHYCYVIMMKRNLRKVLGSKK